MEVPRQRHEMMEHAHVFALTVGFPSLCQLITAHSAKESEALCNMLFILQSLLYSNKEVAIVTSILQMRNPGM